MQKASKGRRKWKREKKKMCAHSGEMIDGGTIQEVDYKKIKIHNLEDTKSNTELKSGSGPLCTCSI